MPPSFLAAPRQESADELPPHSMVADCGNGSYRRQGFRRVQLLLLREGMGSRRNRRHPGPRTATFVNAASRHDDGLSEAMLMQRFFPELRTGGFQLADALRPREPGETVDGVDERPIEPDAPYRRPFQHVATSMTLCQDIVRQQ